MGVEGTSEVCLHVSATLDKSDLNSCFSRSASPLSKKLCKYLAYGGCIWILVPNFITTAY